MAARVFRWLLRGLALAVIAVLCIGWWASRQASLYQTELGPELKASYGFATGTPVISAGGKSVEVLTLYPTAGGLMESAGVEAADIVVGQTLTGFYRRLHEASGTVQFDIVHGGDGPPVKERDKLRIKIVVPDDGALHPQ